MQLQNLLGQFDVRELGKVESYRNLAFVRLLGEDRFAEEVLTLDEVIGTGQFEAKEEGEINRITLRNGYDRKVFIASGMTFEGGTQNRAVIYPFIVPPRSGVINIPVHCVEHGQGLVKGKTFQRSSTILMASARTTETMGSGATRVGQTRTWQGIGRATSTFGLRENVTQDYTAVSRAKGTGIAEYVTAMGKAPSDQLGYIAAVRSNGQIFFYADLFGQRGLYQKLHEKLAQSVATVARQVYQGDIAVGTDDFYRFLNEARTAELQEQEVDSHLLGKIYTADKPVNGIALMLEDYPVQLSLRKDEYKELPRVSRELGRFSRVIPRNA